MLSIKGKVSRIIAIDGAFKYFPHDEPYSTDGSLQMAQRYADHVVCVNRVWDSQIEKRNEAFKYIEPGEYFFIIDTDEVLRGQLKVMGDYTNIKIHEKRSDYWRVRLIKYKSGMQYYGVHSVIAYDNKVINHKDFNDCAIDLIDGYIEHTPENRSPERQIQDADYEKRREEPDPKIIYEELRCQQQH